MAETHPLSVISICGSLRKASFNAALQRCLPELAPEGMTIEALPGIGEMPLYNADVQAEGFPKPVTEMADAIRKADGLIFCTPEYNYSVPGVLKNAIDWVSRLPDQPLKSKAVALQSASQGALGGARAQYHLRQTLVFLEAFVFNRPEIMIAAAKGKFDEAQGHLSDEVSRGLIKQQLAAFASFIRQVTPAA
jgi:chromate reductase